MSPSERAKKYREALRYLDHCHGFTESNLREANRIAGEPLREEDIQSFLRNARDVMPKPGSPGGMEFVKEELRKSLTEGVEVFGSLGKAGVGEKAGCMSVLAILCIGVVLLRALG